jgi:hypothetical protein
MKYTECPVLNVSKIKYYIREIKAGIELRVSSCHAVTLQVHFMLGRHLLCASAKDFRPFRLLQRLNMPQ